MKAVIKGIEYYLPIQTITNQQIAENFPDWSIDKIEKKIGIHQRHIADKDEYVSDMAVAAAEKLIYSYEIDRDIIDYVILCTQTADYLLPSTSCIIQNRLKLRKFIGCIDINLGCSGYVYALSMAKALIESNQAKNILLLTADTYSKIINPKDKTVKTLFGDGASATLISVSSNVGLDNFIFGTDGSGANNLILKNSGMKGRSINKHEGIPIESDKTNNLYMNGPEIFEFALKEIPVMYHKILKTASLTISEIDQCIFHQANEYMLIHLRDKLNIPEKKFFISLKKQGNTVSSSIPIALKQAYSNKVIKCGSKVLLIGFGVGYSWAGCILYLDNFKG